MKLRFRRFKKERSGRWWVVFGGKTVTEIEIAEPHVRVHVKQKSNSASVKNVFRRMKISQHKNSSYNKHPTQKTLNTFMSGSCRDSGLDKHSHTHTTTRSVWTLLVVWLKQYMRRVLPYVGAYTHIHTFIDAKRSAWVLIFTKYRFSPKLRLD